MYGKILMEDLKSELSGSYKKLVKALMYSKPMFDAYELRNAMKGLGKITDIFLFDKGS